MMFSCRRHGEETFEYGETAEYSGAQAVDIEPIPDFRFGEAADC